MIKRLISTFFVGLIAFMAMAQSQTANTLRYFLKNGKTYDIRMSELSQLKNIANVSIKNMFKDTSKPSKDFLNADIDSVVLVYVDYPDTIPSGNINKNTNPKALLLEYPKLKEGSDQLLVIHSTQELGITYSLEWDCTKKSQRWTCFEMHNGLPDNNVGRSGSFREDPDIPSKYRTTLSQYSGSGFSRGHMCASSDRQTTTEQNSQTFYLSNMHPQYQNHNGNLWQALETQVQSWDKTNFRDTLYVVKGGTIDKSDQILTTTSSGLLVPKYFFMAILCVKNGAYKAVAFWTEHTNTAIKKAKPKDYAISIDELEQKTGIDFFCNLPDDIENAVEKSYTPADWGW